MTTTPTRPFGTRTTDSSDLGPHRSLVRWQHVAGDYWPYVCAVPFLRAGELPLPASPRRAEGNRALSAAVAALPRDAGSAIFVDLPPTSTLRAAPALNRLGFVVVPIIQRWVAAPAVLPCGRLVRQLLASGERCFSPRNARGVVFILDGERAGPPAMANRRGHAFDNRYAYPTCRFPPPRFLQSRGINRVYWIAAGELAADLGAYLRSLGEMGLWVSRLGIGSDVALPTTLDRCADRPVANNSVPERGASGRGGRPSRQLTAVVDRSKGNGGLDILVSQPPAPGLYRRFVRRAQIDGLLADHLVGGEPYLALNAAVLDAEEDALLRLLTDTFARVFDRAGRALASDVPALEEMGFPWVAAELLHAEAPRTPLVGRFDFVRDERGHWWLLEFNADTPSGIREAIAVESVVRALLPEARRLSRPSAGLRDALVAAFVDGVRGMPPGSALGLVTSAGELEDLAQMAYTREILAVPLGARGVPVVLGDLDNLRWTPAGLTLGGQHLGALYRYVPFEMTFGTPPFAAIYDVVSSGKLRLLNGLYGLLLQHKGLLAWLWAHRDDPVFGRAERDAIREHVPETWNIGDATPDTDRPARSVVVKQVFGREGEEVYFGDDLSAADWALFRQRRTYVVQRQVALAPLSAVIPTSGGARAAAGYATVGSFAVAGRWAGYYTRFGARIITARAKWLATLAGP